MPTNTVQTVDNTETAWQAPADNSGASKKPRNAAATIKQPKKLTGKQKAFIQHLVANPTEAAYKAVEAAGYKAKDKNTASSIAVENLQKPAIMLELSKYSETMENTILEVINYSKELGKSGTKAGASYAGTALSGANSVLDRLHGKATQRQEITKRSVSLNIDLTSVTEEDTNTP